MARKPHKYHYIYKTTCNVNGKYYIGMHSCSNLEDGYMGSGKKLRRSLNKHGIENHTKEILEFLNDRESLKKREAEIINEELIQDPLCMNLQLGGGGGFSDNDRKKGTKKMLEVLWNNKEWVDRIKKNNSNRMKGNSIGIGNKAFSDRSHSDETKKKMSESSKGKGLKENNSQFGTRWITDGTKNKKIKKDEQIPDGWKLGRIK